MIWRPLLLLLALSADGCDGRITEVVVVVDWLGLEVPRDSDGLSLRVSDPSLPDGSAEQFSQPPVTLCADGQSGACYVFPLSLTLVPGPARPNDPVRVEVQALRGGAVVIDDAATFTFVPGSRRRLDFVLTAGCLGTTCAGADQACGADGQCSAVALTPVGAAPDLRPGLPADLATVADLSAPLADLAASDFGGADLALLSPDLAPVERACGSVDFPSTAAHNYVSAPAVAAYDVNGDFTLEAWVYPTSFSASTQLIANRGSDSFGDYSLRLSSGGRPAFNLSPDGTTTYATFNATALPLNSWTHIAGIYDSTNQQVQLWVGGTQVASSAAPAAPQPGGASPLTVGNSNGANNYQFQGRIDEVRLSAGIRYSSSFVPERRFSPDAASDLALFHFDEASGTVALDASPSANAATLTGTAAFYSSCP